MHNYQLRPLQARAIQLPEMSTTVVVAGVTVPPGNWLVICEEEILTFSDEEFQRRFEPLPAGMAPVPIRAQRVYRRAAKQQKPADPKPATTRPGTIADVLALALKKRPMTLTDCVTLAQQSHPGTTRQSVYSVLYTGKMKYGWLFDDAHGVWRFPLTGAAKVAAE